MLDCKSKMAKIRSSFLKYGELSSEGIRTEIRDSWKRCKEFGLNPETEVVQLPNTIPEYQAKPNQISRFLSDILSEIIDTLLETLAENKAILLCAYSPTLITYLQYGNQELLQYFNARNIGVGTCLKEEFLGTTALSINTAQDQYTSVIGAEHYLDIFVPFATWCYYSTDYDSTYILVIAPKESFTPLLASLLELFCKARKYGIQSYKNSLELTLKNELTDLQNKDQAYILIDSFGKILDANKNFSDWFNLDIKKIKNLDCLKVIPELKRALSCLETGERILFEEIQVKKPFDNMLFARMDVIPQKQMGKIIGLVITLWNSNKVRQTVNKVSNSQSYYKFENIIGESSAFNQVKQKAIEAANRYSTVIITGESGTGKELFAQAIHSAGLRKEGPFVALNCAAMPSELIASELFGYVEGAFTGARKGGSMGKFEYAHQGTIFLDEIGEMPLHAQTLLLRVLEERMVTRIGSNVSVPVDVRLICATNRDLYKMVKAGTFRSDLFYRINVIHLRLPSLRERITDIPILVNHFVQYFNSAFDKKIKEIAPEAMSFLINNDWVGNIRELRNTIECAMNNANGSILELEHLPIENFKRDSDSNLDAGLGVDKEFEMAEKRKILSLMIEYNGNKSLVAQDLGVSRSTLYKKLKAYDF
jgi:transcriptional regulator with PAS, ATPase and Fis domain